MYRTLIVISLPFIFFGIFAFVGNRNRAYFYKSKIESKIIDSSNWQMRTCEYYLPNDLQINISVLDTFKLFVGDSISKEAKSWNYKVFRKRNNEQKFQFVNSYNE